MSVKSRILTSLPETGSKRQKALYYLINIGNLSKFVLHNLKSRDVQPFHP